MWIARSDDPVFRHHHERKRASNLRNGLDNCRLGTVLTGARVQVDNDLGIAVGLKNRAVSHQLVAKLAGVDEVAVMTNRELAVYAIDHDGLSVRLLAFARCRIANVPNRKTPAEHCQRVGVECLVDVAHRLPVVNPHTI